MEEKDNSPLNIDNMAVASPCAASWDDMVGDDRTRHCSSCTKHVYNISEMSRTEANALIAEKEGRLCVRFYRRPDGTVLTDDCPVGLRAVRAGYRKVTTAVASFLALLVAGSAALAGERNNASDKSAEKCVKQPGTTQPIMGDVAAPRPLMGEMIALPAVTTGETWIPKFQKSVEDQLQDSLGSKISAPVQFYMTIGHDGSLQSFTTLGNVVSEDDQKTLQHINKMRFKEFPKDTKLKQVTLLVKVASRKSK